MKTAKIIHNNLNRAIDTIVMNKQLYVKDPLVDFTRDRKLPMATVIKLILSMEGGSLNKELYGFSKQHKIDITSSAFVQQRSKLSSNAFKDIFYQFNKYSRNPIRHKGYRVFAVDGSDFNYFRNPDSESFVTNSLCPYGYNQTHVNAIYDVCNRTYHDVFLQPRNKFDEHYALIKMIQRNTFIGKNIIIMDRGYEGYNTLAHLINTDNLDFLCRVKNKKGMREISKLEMKELDVDISVEITTSQTNEDKRLKRTRIPVKSKKGKINSPKTRLGKWDFPSPYMLKMRVVRFQLDTGKYETVVTSLSRKEFGINDIKELYHMRWGIETSFRELKYVIGAINFHAKKEDLVFQEVYAALIMYNYCSRIASCSAVKRKQKSKYEYKINFTMAVHICRSFYKSFKRNFTELIDDISKYTEPIRPGRQDIRNIKPKRFMGFVYRIAA